MVNFIVMMVEKKGRISVEAAQAEYTRLLVGIWRTRHKEAVDERLTLHGHADYIPSEEGEE